jgi:hypothetical protein
MQTDVARRLIGPRGICMSSPITLFPFRLHLHMDEFPYSFCLYRF